MKEEKQKKQIKNSLVDIVNEQGTVIQVSATTVSNYLKNGWKEK